MDNWGNFETPSSRRDKLEIDHQGETTAQRKKRKQEEQQERWEQAQTQAGQQGGLKQRLGRFKQGGQHRGRGQASEGSWFSLVIVAVIVGGLIWLVWASMNGQLRGVLRSFNSTPDSNVTAFKNAIIDLEYQQKNRPNDNPAYGVYEDKRIHSSDFVEEQVYPEYLVYVFTEDIEKDRPFTEFVLDWEQYSDRPPVYRLAMYDIQEHHQIQQAIPYGQPGLVIYRGLTDGSSVFDSAIIDPVHFPKVADYMEQLQVEYDASQRDRIGTYGQSVGFSQWTEGDSQQEESDQQAEQDAVQSMTDEEYSQYLLEQAQKENPDVAYIDEYGNWYDKYDIKILNEPEN